MIDFIKSMLFSFVTGGAVSIPVLLISKASLWPGIFHGSLVGLCIGFCVMISLTVFFRNNQKNPLFSFLLMILFIGAGTFGGAYFLGVRSVLHFSMLIVSAELAGLGYAYSVYRMNQRINRKLQEKKNAVGEN